MASACSRERSSPPEQPPQQDRIEVRLLDHLDEARVELGPHPTSETTGERTLLEHGGGAPFEAEWVALDGGGRPPRTEARGDQLLLRESACAIVPAEAHQDLRLEAAIAPEQLGPEAAPGQQRLSGLPLVVELNQAPASRAEGCRIDFLVEHSVTPRQGTSPQADEGDLTPHELTFSTLPPTRAVAVVLATGLVVGFTGRTHVAQQPEATARAGPVRLAQLHVGGRTIAEVRQLFASDPLQPGDDERDLRVKPRLDRQLRDAVLAPPGSSFCWTRRIEPGSELRFALGVAWGASVTPGRPVTFRVRAGEAEIFQETLGPDRQGWEERSVGLGDHTGAREICFTTEAAEGNGVVWSLWGTPEITAPAPAGDRPQTVVLVSIDTLRADRLGVYGYDHPTSPVIDELARSSVVFENHIAQTGWTLPSHVSMLTGLSPEAHGVTAQMDRVEDLFEVGFDPSIPTLAAAFREKGYATHGIASGPYLDPVFGFARGFDTYDFVSHDASAAEAHQRSYRDITSERVTRRAVHHLRKAGKRPVFLFVHFWDVHYDYIPSKQDLAAVHPERAAQEIDYNKVGHPFTGHLHPALFGLVVAAGPQHGPLKFYSQVKALMPRFPWVQQRMAVLSDLYDGEVRTVDRHLGYLLGELLRREREDAVIAVTADHGESLMEHGTLGHGLDNIHAEGLVVPLVLRAPGKLEPGRKVVPSTTRDISATLLELSKLPNLPGAQGKSLCQRRDPGTLALGHDGSYSRIQATLGKLRLLVWGRFAQDQLFDLERDPLELNDVGDERAEERAELRRAVARHLLASGRGVHVAVSGDDDVPSFEVTLEADEPLRPAFVYGPHDTGRLIRENEGRRIRLRAYPGPGQLVALTVLVPDSQEVRASVTLGTDTAPAGRVRDGAGEPIDAAVTLAGDGGVRDGGALPPQLDEAGGRVYLWRTPAGQIRQRLEVDEATLEQLRALGYIRGKRPPPAEETQP